MFNTKPYESRLQQALMRLEDDLKKVRTGRAHPNMLEGLMVEAYGTKMPINQVGNIVTIEGQTLQITPFDQANLRSITAAIRDDQNLGLNPSDDGRVVRVMIPPLTTERRQQMAKQLSEKAEDCKINLRNVRHDALRELKTKKDSKEMSEDETKRFEKNIDSLVSGFQDKVDIIIKNKEAEIMSI